MIIGMNMEEIEAAARARIEELQPFYDEYLALHQMLQRTVTTAIPAGRRITYANRPALPAFLVNLISDERCWTLDDVEEAVKASSLFTDRIPTRNTISTRLNELAKRPAAAIEKLPDGTYRALI
jgi:hypothetical protein